MAHFVLLRKLGVFAGAALVMILVGCSGGTGSSEGARSIETVPVALRRLTEEQYRNVVADIFGPDISVAGRFDTIVRPKHLLLETGATTAAISPAGFEQFDVMARAIASQVVDEAHRGTLIPCVPKDATQRDDACATEFFASIGPMVLRRPLSATESQAYVGMVASGVEALGDFYAGLSLGLAAMLVSPDFLYRVEAVEAGASDNSQARLSSYSVASRLSFFLWNSAPDPTLLQAAERGDLHSSAGLRKQVDRMIASPKFERGVRAFFADMLDLGMFDEISKDSAIFPAFTTRVGPDLREQLLRTIVHHVLSEDGDYRGLFTTRETFLTRPLGVLYQMPVRSAQGWDKVELPEDRAGIQALAGFLAVHSHSGRTSPTLRGMAVRELFLCQAVPDPPADVDFSGFNAAVEQATSTHVSSTARTRLAAHAIQPSCAGCHKITDPIGLSLEKFDGIGAFRDTENGAALDVKGELDGVGFDGAAGLGKAIAANPSATRCLTSRAFEYAAGRTRAKGEDEVLKQISERFEKGGYRIPALFREVALNPGMSRARLTPPGKAMTASTAQ